MKTRFTFAAIMLIGLAIPTANADVGELYLPRPAPPAWWGLSGENFVALYRTREEYELKDVKAKIYVDAKDHILKLGAQNNPDPILFINRSGLNESKLKAGKITSATGLTFGVATPLDDKNEIEIKFAGRAWKLARRTGAKSPGIKPDTVNADVLYQLRDDAAKRLFELPPIVCALNTERAENSCSEKFTPLLIADLDLDGVPDLYFTQGQNAPNGGAYLWLSKTQKLLRAKPNEPSKSGPYRALLRPSGNATASNLLSPGLIIPTIEAPLKNVFTDESWFGVYQDKQKSTIKSEKVWAACREGNCDESVRVEAQSAPNPLFFVRGIEGVKPGPVLQAEIKVRPADAQNEDVFGSFDIELAGRTTELRGGKQSFTVVANHHENQLALKTQDPDDKPALFWAGDLDRNGELDVVFKFPGDEHEAFQLFMNITDMKKRLNGPTAKF